MKTIRTLFLFSISFGILLFVSLAIFDSMVQGFLHGQIPLLDITASEQNVHLRESPILFWVTVTLHSIVAGGLVWFWFCYIRSVVDFAFNRL